MNEDLSYRVPDILDVIYKDVVEGLYSQNINKNRVVIAKCNLVCDYLLRSNYTEEEIAELVGFPEVEDLREVFKGFLNIYPGEFRKRFQDVNKKRA